jgi:hypothetical protein
MAISKDAPIDFAKIAAEMRQTVARWYNATVEVFDPNLEGLEWDPETNEYSGDPEVIVWSGSARVQPIRNATVPELGVMQGAIESIRVQIPYDAEVGLIRKGMMVRVTDGGEDTVLQNLSFVVRSAVNSSYGWNRTIECDVDVKNG